MLTKLCSPGGIKSPLKENDKITFSLCDISNPFSFRKPILFIDTPRKINNVDYKELEIEPFEVRMRTIVGEYFDSKKKYRLEKINCIKDSEINKNVFSLGVSAKIGKKYIVNFLKEKN